MTKFYKSFTFCSYDEKKEYDSWVLENGVEIVRDLDGGMYGRRIIIWKSDKLTNGELVRGSGYESLHGMTTRSFSSEDKKEVVGHD